MNLIGAWGALAALACSDPALNVPAPPAMARVTFEPPDQAGRVLPTFRARLQHAAGTEPWLFSGDVSPYQERSLARGELSAALRERAVALFFWADGADLWLQPLRWLEPAQSYTLALLGRGVVSRWQVSEEKVARARLLFPAGVSAGGAAVHCGPGLRAPEGAALSPAGRMDATQWEGPQPCVVWSARGQLSAPAVLPPSVGGVLLEPALFGASGQAGALVSADCAGLLLHGSCLEALDDRVLVTALAADSLWLLEEPQARTVLAPAGRRVALARGLPPAASFRLRGQVLQDTGTEAIDLKLETASPRLHLAITEVLANPLGVEPASEWVELFNDSAAPAALAGLWLTDGSGSAALPPVTLSPGEIALMVPPGFAPSADVAVAPGTRLLQLPTLGGRGLGNSGEPLLLLGGAGVLARFPVVPAPHAGRSIARLSLDARDDDAAAFAEHDAPGASPGTAHWAN